MTSYIGETSLREMMTQFLRWSAPSVLDVTIERLPGPFLPRNWHVARIDVLVEDYGRARDAADLYENTDDWIVVPDRHVLAGQVYGREADLERDWDQPLTPGEGEAYVEDPGYGSVLREIKSDVVRLVRRLRRLPTK